MYRAFGNSKHACGLAHSRGAFDNIIAYFHYPSLNIVLHLLTLLPAFYCIYMDAVAKKEPLANKKAAGFAGR